MQLPLFIMIIGIVGLIGSGKSTLANILVDQHGFRSDSFSHTLKDMVSVLFGWPREMVEGITPESRAWREVPDPYWSEKLGIHGFTPRFALQNIGTDVLRKHFHDQIWLLTLFQRYHSSGKTPTVISDVRYPNELAAIRQNGGLVIRISRGEPPPWYQTASLANLGDASAAEKMATEYESVHASEWSLAGVPVDHEINNQGTLMDLERQISSIINV